MFDHFRSDRWRERFYNDPVPGDSFPHPFFLEDRV